jgi:hypothetical protein
MKTHLKQSFFCDDCRTIFNSHEKLSLHKKSRDCEQIGSGRNVDFEDHLELSSNNPIELTGKAFKSFVKLYTLVPERKFQDPKQLILHYQNDFNELFSKLLSTDLNMKVQLCFQILFEKNLETEEGDDGFKTIENIAYFCPFPSILNHVDNIDEVLSTQALEIEKRIDRFVNQGSFWNVNRIIKVDIRIGKYITRYGCYDKKLPYVLYNKKALLNIKTFDDKCFLWSIIAHKFPVDYSDYKQQCNVSNYLKYENYFNTDDIKFPVSLEMITKFEKKNHLSINIYGYRLMEELLKFEIVPIKIAKNFGNNINLLLYEDHFYLIKNFNRLCANEHNCGHHFCYFCLQAFRNKKLLNNHMNKCKKIKPQRVILPEENENILRFKEYNQQIKFPFVIYADFETLTSKVNIKCTSKTKIFQNHIVSSYGYVIIDSNKDIVFSDFYRGEDANEKFLYSIKKEGEKLLYYLRDIKKLTMTEDDKISFKAARYCSLCGLEFKRFERKNRDHGKAI